MSLDISLYDIGRSGEKYEVLSMNWLRNPFGLERWAETNAGVKVSDDQSLYYVCNHWAYDNSIDHDDPHHDNREFFKEVVDHYGNALHMRHRNGETFYFAFTNENLINNYVLDTRILPHFPLGEVKDAHFIKGAVWGPGEGGARNGAQTLFVPMQHFETPAINNRVHLLHYGSTQTLLAQYIDWYNELMKFAEALVAHPEYEFYCSN
jgi:hypothetical protein